MPSTGIARSASSSAASGAVTNVGWNAVVPVASSASPTRTYPSRSVAMQVHAREPVDLQVDEARARRSRSRRRTARRATIDPPSISTSPGHERAVDQRRFDAQPHPFTAPAVRAVIRCLRASTNTSATGSV